MTTPARYCCTLQQSKRLRELGVMSESLYYIIQGDDSQEQTIFTKSELIQLLKDSAVDQYMSEQPSGYTLTYDRDKLHEYALETFRDSILSLEGDDPEIYPAYTVGELGEMLPYRIWVGDKMYVQTIIKVDSSWHKAGYNTKGSYWYQYEHLNSDRLLEVLGNYQKEFPTQAQSAADILIYLLENSLITPSQVNNQLK